MKIKLPLLSLLAATALAAGVSLPASAQSGIIIGDRAGSRINVRSAPTIDSYSPHYGLVGDRIEIIKQSRSYDGYSWYYVRFPSGAEGWVRGDFVQPVTVPVSYPGSGYPDYPSDSGYGREQTVAVFQTNTYSVKVFKHRGRLYMNVYNKRTGEQELNWSRAEVSNYGRGASYYSGRYNYGYSVSRSPNGRYVIEVTRYGHLIARERGYQVW